MMFRGTKKYPQAAYQRIVAGMGAQANAFTTDDFTAFHLTVTRDDLERVVQIESDRFQNLFYEKPAFQTEAGAVYGEYRKNMTQPMALLDEKIHDLAFNLQTYKHTTMGFEADIKRMPEAYDYSRDFFQRFYRPENVVLLMVGDVDMPTAHGLVWKYYGDWKSGYAAPKVPVDPPQTAPRTAEIRYPGATLPLIDMAYKGDRFDPDNRDYVAAILLGDLAFGPTSQLYKRLVLREQKAEFIGASIPMNRDPTLFEITAMVKQPGDLAEVQKAIDETLAQFQTKPVDEQMLRDVKRHHKYSFLTDLESTDKVANHLTRFVALTGGIEAVDRLYAAIQRVTSADVLHAAQKYFVAQGRTVVVLKGTQ
jgi:zinc protease